MALAATLDMMDAGTLESLNAKALPSVDWAREYPEEQYVRLAAGWRVVVLGTAAIASWMAVGGIVLSVARGVGAI